MKKLVIVDGNSLINRAFYAMPYLTGGGHNTGGVFGLANMIFQLLEDYSPSHFLVAFDKKGKTFRHNMYDQYKGNRKGMPPELAEQMPIAKELLDLMGIPRVEISGYEADDIIGTVAKKCVEDGINTYVFTGDKDILQLISYGAKVCITIRGVSEIKEYTEAHIAAEYGGISSAQITDFKGLSGDKSDNIPGIPGVGPKKTEALLRQFGTVENLVENTSQVENVKLRSLVEKYAQQALLSKQLATIVCEAPLDFEEENLITKKPDFPELYNFFDKLQFRSLKYRLKLFEQNWGSDPVELQPRKKVNLNKELLSTLSKINEFSIELSTSEPITAAIVSGNSYWLVEEADFTELSSIFEDKKVAKRSFNSKPLFLALKKRGINLKGLDFDSSIAAFLVKPDMQTDLIKISSEYGLLSMIDDEVEEDNLQTRAYLNQQLSLILKKELDSKELMHIYQETELPLIEILADIEYRGFRVDEGCLKEIGDKLRKKITALKTEIYELAGEEFNVDSPKQFGNILFDKLKLPHSKKTKTGYSTNKKVLSKLVTKHAIVGKMLHYRTYAKLMSTYVEGLGSSIVNGRVHTSLLQTAVITGRLSSKEPNLQNIPIRLDEGRELRKLFIADEDSILIDADYSQIELRVLAHFSKDERLIDAFNNDEDIHAITASEVFSVPIDEINSLQRSRAKEVNFGIVYGMGDYGLSESLSIPVYEAKRYIEGYFKTYPGVKEFMDSILLYCKNNGYVKTILGRKRWIPAIKSSNFNLRSSAERIARNTPIQGSAADIIKIAMISVYRELKKRKLRSYLLLQVHDELIINAYNDEKEEVRDILKKCMQEAYNLLIPLKVDINEGANWYESK